MKIICEKNEFLRGIRTVQNALTSNALPILSHILMSTKDQKVRLIATNLEITIFSFFSAEIIEEGEICLPGDKLASVIRELPPSRINLETENSSAKITCEKSVFHLLGLEPAEYPEVPQTKGENTFSISSKKLMGMIQKTSFAASVDETRQNLNGVCLELEEGEMRMIATDGRRLSYISIPHPSLNIPPMKVLIPLKALQNLLRILSEGEVGIGIEKQQIFFKLDDTLLVSQLIEANFPDYRGVIPPEYKIVVLSERDKLLESIRRASLLSNEKSRLLKFKLKGENLIITANSPEIGSSYEELKVKKEGEEDIEIGFNSAYLMDVLKNMEGEVRLEMRNSRSSGVIRPATEENYIYVIMPIKIEEEVETP